MWPLLDTPKVFERRHCFGKGHQTLGGRVPGGLSGPSAHFFRLLGHILAKFLAPFLGPNLEGLLCRLYWVSQKWGRPVTPKMGPAILFLGDGQALCWKPGAKKVREWLKRLAHLRTDSNYIKCSAKAHLGRAGDRKCKRSSSV